MLSKPTQGPVELKSQRKVNRRQFVRGLGLGASALALTPLLKACGEATSTPTVAPKTVPAVINGTVTLKLMTVGTEAEAANEYAEFNLPNLKQFMAANPNIKVERNAYTTDYFDLVQFKAMVAAGSPPDIFRVSGSQVPSLVRRSIPLDLTAYYKGSSVLKLDDLSPVNKYYNVDGKQYGNVQDWSPDWSLFINKDAFTQAGLPLPSTTQPLSYAELATLAQKLTKREGDKISQMGFNFEPYVRTIQLLLAQQGATDIYKPDFSEVVLKDNPKAMEVLKYHFDLAKANVIYSPINPVPDWNGPAFIKGQLAMVQYGYWFSQFIATQAEPAFLEKVLFVPGPVWSGGKRLNPSQGGTGYMVSKTTKNPDAAFKLFEFYFGGEPTIQRVKKGRGVPNLKSHYPLMPNDTPLAKQIQTVLQDELKYSDFVLPVNPYYEDSTFSTTWIKYLEKALIGSTSFEQMVVNLESEVNKAIAQGRNI
jgi:multiple sugar transport system substrate-binding protein